MSHAAKFAPSPCSTFSCCCRKVDLPLSPFSLSLSLSHSPPPPPPACASVTRGSSSSYMTSFRCGLGRKTCVLCRWMEEEDFGKAKSGEVDLPEGDTHTQREKGDVSREGDLLTVALKLAELSVLCTYVRTKYMQITCRLQSGLVFLDRPRSRRRKMPLPYFCVTKIWVMCAVYEIINASFRPSVRELNYSKSAAADHLYLKGSAFAALT